MDELVFTELKIQNYLISEERSLSQKHNIFAFRTRMSEFSENFRNGGPSIPCKLCYLHVDSQNPAINCEEVRKVSRKQESTKKYLPITYQVKQLQC